MHPLARELDLEVANVLGIGIAGLSVSQMEVCSCSPDAVHDIIHCKQALEEVHNAALVSLRKSKVPVHCDLKPCSGSLLGSLDLCEKSTVNECSRTTMLNHVPFLIAGILQAQLIQQQRQEEEPGFVPAAQRCE